MTFAKSSRARGFTLIELLVVISIIGLLSSVVLASVASARAKAADAAIKSNVRNLQTTADVYFDTNGVYGASLSGSSPCSSVGNVFAYGSIPQALASSLALVGGSSAARCSIGLDGRSWSLSVPLRTGGTYCVSSVSGVAAGTDQISDQDCNIPNAAYCHPTNAPCQPLG